MCRPSAARQPVLMSVLKRCALLVLARASSSSASTGTPASCRTKKSNVLNDTFYYMARGHFGTINGF